MRKTQDVHLFTGTAAECANDYWRKAKCSQCKYAESCYSIADGKIREICANLVTDGGRAYVTEAPRWSEMSYYHF